MSSSTTDRVPSGAVLIAPVFELVDLARKLGRLDELRTQLQERKPANREQTKSKHAVQILIAGAEEDIERYGNELNEFMTLVRESPVLDPERAPELVVVWEGVRDPRTRVEIRDLLFLLREQMKFSNFTHRERVKRHISSLNHLLDDLSTHKESSQHETTSKETLSQWQPVSRRTAETRGKGFPNSAWSIDATRARHISSHDDDYLYFSLPLRGDFEIEGDFSTFAYREIRIATGTIWAGPLYDHEHLSWGTFRREQPRIRLVSRFSELGDQMRVRVAVKDGIRTTYINGRNVFQRPQDRHSDPWISVHSPWHTSGVMENVRIGGSPEIPEEIDLLPNPDLPGWLPYYDESAGGQYSNWILQESLDKLESNNLIPTTSNETKLLIGRRSDAPSGSFHESLLRYHRPMLEDGVIEYEFFYQQGEYGVYPSLDRLAFVFDEATAGIHWLTDGKFDQTSLDPGNHAPEKSEQPPRLIPDEWNRVRLSLRGDIVEVALNGETIVARSLEPENLRTFGLFHYSDRTEARVRNMRWRGEWSRHLPSIINQQLADLSLEQELDRGPEMSVIFEHDFSKGVPTEKIWISGKDWSRNAEQRPSGFRMTQSGGSYQKSSLALPFALEGDFDVTWEFEDLQAEVVEGGNGNVHLLIYFDDDRATECRVYRKQSLTKNGKHEQLVQPSIFYRKPDGKTHYGFPVNVAEESTSGKLRLVRRGSEMYFLYAEGDSNHFRLTHQETLTDAPVKFAGIKGIIETHQEGETSAVWKRVTVKAETKPEFLSVQSVSLQEVNETRSKLANTVSYTMNQKLPLDQFVVWGERSHITQENDGWIIKEPGTKNWQATGIGSLVGLRGDFDVSLDFEILKLEPSAPNGESTVLLHTSFDTARPLGFELKYSQSSDSERELEIQMNSSGRDGGLRFEELKHQRVHEVTQFRFARRGSVAYLIYRGTRDSEPKIFGRVEVGAADVTPNYLRTLVHTAGAGKETIVRLKSMSVHADHLIQP